MDSAALLQKRLRLLRRLSGLTQEQFAAYADFDYKFYQRLETRHGKEILLSTLDRLAKAYDLAPWQLLAPELPKTIHMAKPKRPFPTRRIRRRPGENGPPQWKASFRVIE
jgi:transcriptional regulator with XRE-family HTH domain